MKRLLVTACAFALIVSLGGCAALREYLATPEGQEVVEKSGSALGSILTGDVSGAVGQTLDIALILLGLKGAQKGGQIAKRRLVNPPEVMEKA